MSLDSKLKEIVETKKGFILIVDDRCDVEMPASQHDDAYMDHCTNENRCNTHARDQGIELTLLDASHRDIQNQDHSQRARSIQRYLKQLDGEHSLIVVASNMMSKPLSIVDAERSLCTVAILGELVPQAEIVYVLPNFEGETLNACFDKVFGLMHPEAAEKAEKVDFTIYPTLMHLLAQKMTGEFVGEEQKRALNAEQHRYENGRWKDNYLPHIDESLRAGNLQTEADYHFLVLSDKEIGNLGRVKRNAVADEKIKVEGNDYVMNDVDLEKCAAIFIDNAWDGAVHTGALGDGIETLRRIRKQMDEKGINIPIIYQSGHRAEDFTADEEIEIEELGAVLAPKNVFPKVCRKELSEKEIEMGDILNGQIGGLELFTANIVDFGPDHKMGNGNMFVVCSTIVDELPDFSDLSCDSLKYKKRAFSRIGLEDNLTNHKMYVLSLFHSELKEEIGNEKLQATSIDFYDLDEVIASAPHYAAQLDPIRQLYNNITDNHREFTPRVLTHNDAKSDNWFQGMVLGDFGSVQPGMEYKDVAKALMDEALDKDAVDLGIDVYLALREDMGDAVSDNHEDFRKCVYEMIVTESLRTLRYKADQKELAEKLVKTAEMYSGILIGEYAEYRTAS